MSVPPEPLAGSASPALKGTIRVPGDKSISHRALMLASQCLGITYIEGLLEGEDVLGTAHALTALGVDVLREGNGTWTVHGRGVGGLAEPEEVLDLGNAGTATRLLMGLLTPYNYTSLFTGDASLRARPMGRVIIPLAQIGARFAGRSGGRLPLALTGTGMPVPVTYRLPVASAQVKSAILLAGLNIAGKTTVIEPEASRDHTENMLRHLGFPVEVTTDAEGARTITVTGHHPSPRGERTLQVPADPSSAAFPMVAALIVPGSRVTLSDVCINPLRTGLMETLREMGADIAYASPRTLCGEAVADITVAYSPLKAITVPASRAPSMIDEYPILAIAAAFAEGETIMHGLKELRVKESDRLSAVLNGLKACGVTARIEGEDTLIVCGFGGTGKLPHGGTEIAANLDHRIAMAFLVMGLASEKPVTVDDGRTIATSFPGFVSLMNGLGARIAPVYPLSPSARDRLTIAIDGPAASGKGTLARRLAEHLGYHYLDTGSLYRAVGLKLVYSGQDPADSAAAVKAARSITPMDLANPRLRQEKVGKAASVVAAMPAVRDALLQFQRDFAAEGGVVLDGRDIGTIVCPEADLKIFITASLDKRAERRHRELQGEGIEVVYDSVLEDLTERDERDSKRSTAPLTPAADAVMIDSSALDANAVFSMALAMVNEKLRDKVG